MKKANMTISFGSEKLDALTYHMGKKDTNLQTELEDTIQKLYEKHVPQATREYIDDKLSREAAAKSKPKRPVRPAAVSSAENSMA